MSGRIWHDGQVIADLDEDADGTVTATGRDGKVLGTWARYSHVDDQWRHHTAHTRARTYVLRLLTQ